MYRRITARLVLAVALAGVVFASHSAFASADWKDYGTVHGETYLNNYFNGYSHGVWDESRRVDWQFTFLELDLHPEYATTTCDVGYPGGCLIWHTDWHARPVQYLDRYGNYFSLNDYQSNHAMRGWSYHQDYSNNYSYGETSDGY